MGAAEEKSKGGKYIKPPVRKAIKKMAYISQIANCVNQLPSPEEFATQVVGEVTVLMGKIRDFTVRINDMMEAYTNFPADFLTESTNNIMGTLTNYANVATGATQGMVDALQTTTNNMESIITEGTGLFEEATKDSNFEYNGENVTLKANAIVDEGDDIFDKATEGIGKVTDKVNSVNEGVNKKLQEAVDYINKRMQAVNDTLNDAFSDYIVNDMKREDAAEEMQKISDSTNTSTIGGELTSSVTDTMSTIVKNFNIGKIATGFLGLATNIGLVAIGIDKLPELNLDNVLAFGRAKMEDVYEKKKSQTREFKESDEYLRIVEAAEGDKKKLREKLRLKRKESAQQRRRGLDSISQEERDARRSVAKDVRKARLQAKKAKISQKIKETIGLELERFKTDLNMFGTNIKDEWMMMQNQYKQSVEEIKKFFTGDPNEAPGSKYIDDCCDAIELDCDSIKEILKNLTTTITVTVSQIPCPTSVGSCFDNPLYKVLRWFECAKVIFNEIRRVINFGIDIIKQIDNLAKIILNGLNSLKEIKDKLMEILNIKWLLDFIDSIIELFMGKCLEGKELIENTISPIYYNETDDYEQRMNALEEQVANLDDDDKNAGEKLEKKIDELEEYGETICAYKSPILNEDGTDFKAWIFYYSNIDNRYRSSQKLKRLFSRMIMKRAAKTGHRKRGGVNMLKSKKVFKLYYGMNVNGETTYRPKAYDAFYWYTKWTTDPNDDNLDRTEDEINNNEDIISPVMTTENGTLVELEDGRRVFVNDFGIKSGDYVLVEGQRYRVK
jgi:hypothetical protein